MAEHHKRRTALVAYGSETGNAQELAEELGRVTRRLHFIPRVVNLDSLNVSDLLRHSIVLIAISTTGQGDLPNNSQLFWRKLRSSRLTQGCLSRVCFASFGLGDSAYPQFNWAHRKFNNRLRQLGAQEIFEKGEADESAPEGADGLFVPWCGQLRQKLLHHWPLENGLKPIPDDEFLTPDWKLELLETPTSTNGGWGNANSSSDGHQKTPLSMNSASDHANITNEDTYETSIFTNGLSDREGSGKNDIQDELSHDLTPTSNAITATLTRNNRLTPNDHWQDVRLVDFILPHTSYTAGSVCTIHPKNFRTDVDDLLSLMNWTPIADKSVRFAPTNPYRQKAAPASPSPITLAEPFTLRQLLTNHLDILSIPRRSFFTLISHFTSDPSHKERLLEFTRPDLIDEFYDYTTRPRRSILEVLQEFDSVKIPWKYAAAAFPSIRGRQFSIASGGALGKGDTPETTRVQLLVAIVQYRTVIKRIRRGLCTRYLAALKPGTKLNVTIGRGSGSGIMDTDPTRPAIMVGPGTGVAPLRSMIHERLEKTSAAGQATADGGGDRGEGGSGREERSHASPHMLLFFGARNREKDFFFEDEWKDLGALHQTTSSSALPPGEDIDPSPHAPANVRIITAFSRDPPDASSLACKVKKGKFYVQDAIRAHSDEVRELILRRNARVFVSGSSGAMPKAVGDAVSDALVGGSEEQDDGMSREDAEAWVARMRKSGDWWEECW
ncbi:MAG: NAPDH-dependent diflavin reductase [Alyxoria varia]|nr:MAG: NAPDH-dependent diflavin reductase [Alyxoria varia]